MFKYGNDLDGLNVPNFAILVCSTYKSKTFLEIVLMLKHKNAIVKKMFMHTGKNSLTE